MPVRILIADDDPNIRLLLQDWLQDQPWEIKPARHGKEALTLLEKEPFDIAVLDLNMPFLDGLEVCEAVQKRDLDIDIVFLTAYGTVSTAVRAIKMGAHDYLEKPLRRNDLIVALQKIIARRYPSSHVLADRLHHLLQEQCTNVDLRLSDLCATLKISTRYASLMFREHLGVSFRKLLVKYRVQHAKKLLETSDAPLYLIAEQCGFKNYQRLTEAFKRLEGLPPGRYRKIDAYNRSTFG